MKGSLPTLNLYILLLKVVSMTNEHKTIGLMTSDYTIIEHTAFGYVNDVYKSPEYVFLVLLAIYYLELSRSEFD